MADDWVARGIAMGSALGTGLNMLIAYKTYRRTRPRVVLTLERVHRKRSGPRLLDFDPVIVMQFRVQNRSATAVEVERLEFCYFLDPWELSPYDTGKRAEGKTVGPFSGAQFLTYFPQKWLYDPDPSGPLGAFLCGYPVLTLASGQEVRGKKISRRYLTSLPEPRY